VSIDMFYCSCVSFYVFAKNLYMYIESIDTNRIPEVRFPDGRDGDSYRCCSNELGDRVCGVLRASSRRSYIRCPKLTKTYSFNYLLLLIFTGCTRKISQTHG